MSIFGAYEVYEIRLPKIIWHESVMWDPNQGVYDLNRESTKTYRRIRLSYGIQTINM